ncbi:GntR family transcriptional regulator [Streptomyces sp. NPDC085946]|uniref:GntR family transcriptional regulator n=1 Tax=Streptomyces sp. NPDC085946 TaxID=3365744 RepID=UPI0037D702B1
MARAGDRARPAPAPATGAPDFAPDRGSPVPLHHRLAQQPEAAIGGGVLAPGNLLGDEAGRTVRPALSRPAVRRAVRSLVDKGLPVRRRGVGTRVVHSRVRRPPGPSGLHDGLEAAGPGPSTLVVRHGTVPASADVAAAPNTAEGGEAVLLERPRRTHGRPVALPCAHLPTGLPDLDDARLESTGLYRPVRAAGITPRGARRTVGARPATAAEAARLDEEAGAALLTTRRTAYDDTGRPVEYGTRLYRASRYSSGVQPLVRP